MTPQQPGPLVGIIMGSKADWPTMQRAAEVLELFDVPHESRIVSAHRTPRAAEEYAESAEARGIQVIIAGAGGAAHLAGVVAAHTVLPVLGVPMASTALSGLDSLLSIVQMPSGVPVGTLAIGDAGARNAAYLATAILGLQSPRFLKRLRDYRATEAARVAAERLPQGRPLGPTPTESP